MEQNVSVTYLEEVNVENMQLLMPTKLAKAWLSKIVLHLLDKTIAYRT